MTGGERRAFERGFAYAAEAMIEAHDPLIEVVSTYEAAMRCALSASPSPPAVGDPRVVAAVRAVKHVRFDGAAEALAMFEFEQAMADA